MQRSYIKEISVTRSLLEFVVEAGVWVEEVAAADTRSAGETLT